MTISANTTNIYKTNYPTNQVAQAPPPAPKETENAKPEGNQPPPPPEGNQPPPPPEGKQPMSAQGLSNAQGMLASKSSVSSQNLTSETSTVTELTSEVEEDNEASTLEMLKSMTEDEEETINISNAINQYVKTNATQGYSFNVTN
ncbi:hypothetical protein AN644_04710 [Candidatus Epulonipiscium fishelsonii]|nr:hypothetical protein AN644_04710 [Epulopiscium sp. SCG-C06WGA-EpuloA1]